MVTLNYRPVNVRTENVLNTYNPFRLTPEPTLPVAQ